MTKELTIKEAIEYLHLSEKTIRRRIKEGKLKAEKRGHQWFILVNNGRNTGPDDKDFGQNDPNDSQSDLDNGQLDRIPDPSALIEQLQSENQHLREQVDHLTQIVAMSQKNIGQLTEQLDTSRAVIEDMRTRPWWKRLFDKE